MALTEVTGDMEELLGFSSVPPVNSVSDSVWIAGRMNNHSAEMEQDNFVYFVSIRQECRNWRVNNAGWIIAGARGPLLPPPSCHDTPSHRTTRRSTVRPLDFPRDSAHSRRSRTCAGAVRAERRRVPGRTAAPGVDRAGRRLLVGRDGDGHPRRHHPLVR